jgi:gamma-butyrobetaine dioxygenase
VTEPVRLHVAAKRYLCAAEPSYFAKLSEASVYTLSVQGGPMSDAEAREFVSLPYAAPARVRPAVRPRWAASAVPSRSA